MGRPTTCDVCRRCTHDDIPALLMNNYKVKRLRSGGLTEPRFWQRIDICDDCAKGMHKVVADRVEEHDA